MWFDVALTAFSVLGVGVLLLISDRSDRGLVSDLLLLGVLPAAVAMQVRQWRWLVATGSLLEIGPAGVRVHQLGRGWLSLPWEDVGSVGPAVSGRTVVVRPAPGVDRSTPGTRWPDGRLVALRARRWGFRVPLRLGDADMNQVMAAVRHFSGGRF
jgi:hypothetical protein